jgi:hypothetical protein
VPPPGISEQAAQQFTVTIEPPLQITPTALPAGTAGKPYSHDLDLNAQGGTPPYNSTSSRTR